MAVFIHKTHRTYTDDLQVGFDEDAEADQFFAWHIIQIEHHKFNDFKEFSLKTRILIILSVHPQSKTLHHKAMVTWFFVT